MSGPRASLQQNPKEMGGILNSSPSEFFGEMAATKWFKNIEPYKMDIE